MWTDELLASRQKMLSEIEDQAEYVELYRLARMGRALEGSATVERISDTSVHVTFKTEPEARAFITHPAWRRE